METLNYKVLESTGYNGYILKDAPVKVMHFWKTKTVISG